VLPPSALPALLPNFERLLDAIDSSNHDHDHDSDGDGLLEGEDGLLPQRRRLSRWAGRGN